MAQVSAMLVVAVLVLNASGQVLRNGHCPKVTSEEKLDVTKYMGIWYEQVHTRRWTGLELKCNIEYLIEESSTRGYYLHSFMYSPGANRTFHVHGKARFLSETESKLLVKIDVLEKEGEVWILGTDLTSYTVMYSCLNVKNHHFERELYVLENLVIMTREPHPPNSVLNKAFRVLSKNKIRPTKLQFTSHYACPHTDVEAISRAHCKRPGVHSHNAAIKQHVEATEVHEFGHHVKHEEKVHQTPEHTQSHAHYENAKETEHAELHENKEMHKNKETPKNREEGNEKEMHQPAEHTEPHSHRESAKKTDDTEIHESKKKEKGHEKEPKGGTDTIKEHGPEHTASLHEIVNHEQPEATKEQHEVVTEQVMTTKPKNMHSVTGKPESKHEEHEELKPNMTTQTPDIKISNNDRGIAMDDKVLPGKHDKSSTEIKIEKHEERATLDKTNKSETQSKDTKVEARKLEDHTEASEIHNKVTSGATILDGGKKHAYVTTVSPEVTASDEHAPASEKHESPEKHEIQAREKEVRSQPDTEVWKSEDHVLHHSTLPPQIKAKKLEEKDLHSLTQDKPLELQHPKVKKMKEGNVISVPASEVKSKEVKVRPESSKLKSTSNKPEDETKYSSTLKSENTEAHVTTAAPENTPQLTSLAPEIDSQNTTLNPRHLTSEVKSTVPHKDKSEENENISHEVFKKEKLVGHELTAPKPNKMVPIKLSSRDSKTNLDRQTLVFEIDEVK